MVGLIHESTLVKKKIIIFCISEREIYIKKGDFRYEKKNVYSYDDDCDDGSLFNGNGGFC